MEPGRIMSMVMVMVVMMIKEKKDLLVEVSWREMADVCIRL